MPHVLELLPLALGIAVNPIPAIVAIILIRVGRGSGLAFLVGWLAGLAALTLVGLAVAEAIEPGTPEGPRSPLHDVVILVVGLGVAGLGVRKLARRPRGEESVAEPAWMSRLGGAGPGRALPIGIGLAVANPKHIGLALSAATVIGAVGPEAGGIAPAVIAFVLLASPAVIAPILVGAAGGPASRTTLDRWHAWLVRRHTLLLGGLLVLIGGILIVAGVRGFVA